MKTVILSSWEQAVAARKMTGGFCAALFLAAAALALMGLLGVDNVKWPMVVFTLLASHAMTAHFAFRRIAQLQASLDMKRMALRVRETQDAVAGRVVHLNSGETLAVQVLGGNPVILEALSACSLRRIP